MQTFSGAAMDLDETAMKNAASQTPDDQAETLADTETLAELIAEFCQTGTEEDTKSPLRVAHFAMDLFIHKHETRLRRLEIVGQQWQTAETMRVITLARTVRRKLSKLYAECGRVGS